jgi:hypothetical protein
MDWSLYWMIMWQTFIGLLLLSIGLYVLAFAITRGIVNAVHPERLRKGNS